MELMQENDSVLAGVTRTDRDGNGGYSHVTKGP
jgi:hypothetical protein